MTTMGTPQGDSATAVLQLALDAAHLVQDIVPAYGVLKTTADHRAVMRDAAHFRVKLDGAIDPRPSLFVCPPGGMPLLLVNPAHHRIPARRAFLELREVFRVLVPGVGPLAEAAATLLASVGVVSQEDWTTRGDAWVLGQLVEIEAVCPEWFAEWAGDLMRLVKRLYAAMPRPDGHELHPDSLMSLELSGSSLAYELGVRARNAFEHERAARWFMRAFELGEASGDHGTAAKALLGVARTSLQRGANPRAITYYTAASEYARGHAIADVEGMAEHDLAVQAIKASDWEQVADHALRAARAYASTAHPSMVALVSDLAEAWMRQGAYASAYHLLRTMADRCPVPEYARIGVFGNTAICALRLSELPVFERCIGLVEREIERGSPFASQSLYEIGIVVAAYDEPRGEQLIRRAANLAAVRGEHEWEMKAQQALEVVRMDPPASQVIFGQAGLDGELAVQIAVLLASEAAAAA